MLQLRCVVSSVWLGWCVELVLSNPRPFSTAPPAGKAGQLLQFLFCAFYLCYKMAGLGFQEAFAYTLCFGTPACLPVSCLPPLHA